MCNSASSYSIGSFLRLYLVSRWRPGGVARVQVSRLPLAQLFALLQVVEEDFADAGGDFRQFSFTFLSKY